MKGYDRSYSNKAHRRFWNLNLKRVMIKTDNNVVSYQNICTQCLRTRKKKL